MNVDKVKLNYIKFTFINRQHKTNSNKKHKTWKTFLALYSASKQSKSFEVHKNTVYLGNALCVVQKY